MQTTHKKGHILENKKKSDLGQLILFYFLTLSDLIFFTLTFGTDYYVG